MKTTPENQLLFQEQSSGVQLYMKRLDKEFPGALGNKVYKLKYNLREARRLGRKTLLTFGGAYSNHIAALAAVGKEQGFNTVGLIRGEELGRDWAQTLRENPTLSAARKNGMSFEFISRQAYRKKHTLSFRNALLEKYDDLYILPEGGTNPLAIKGCEEILTAEDQKFDVICCSVGTGGTLSGLINSASADQIVLGFSALNTDLTKTVNPYVYKQNWEIFPETNFGGFAKINADLVSFINRFAEDYGILLDPIYTGKMMFAVMDKIKKGDFDKKTHILTIHSGGLQGIEGMNMKLVRKGLPLIND